MSYATLMVQLELGESNANLLHVVGDLSERFDAGVIGIAACQPILVTECYDGGNLVQQDRDDIEKEIEEAKEEFRAALHNRVKSAEWRSAITYASLSDYVSREARSADLMITGIDSDPIFEAARSVDTADLIMQIGRPVLTVPTDCSELNLDRIDIGWKDTREARRAVLDAVPLLKVASHVSVIGIAPGKDLEETRIGLDDVVAWLRRHGITAEPIAVSSDGDDVSTLNSIVKEQGGHILVAGAYGHSRLREWVLGGVTRNLLLRPDRCSLLSH